MGFSLYASAQGWTQLSDFPSSARDDGASFRIDEITYCGTGLDATWTPNNDFFAFDLNTDSWSTIAALPNNEARQYASGFASANNGFVFGGINGSGYLNDLWKYDVLNDTWSEVSPMPSVGRSGTSCFVIGDTAYIMGGQTASTPTISEMWAYSMSSDTWIQKNSIPVPLWRASSISHQGKGYLLFGISDGMYQNNMYEYSPDTDSWSNLMSFPGLGRTYVGIAVLNNEIVTVAGLDSLGNSYNDFWRYSTQLDAWTMSVNIPGDQRRGGMCFYSNWAVYYTTGIDYTNTRLTETWKYDLFLSAEEDEKDPITIYPNPSSDYMYVSGKTSLPFHFEFITLTGNILVFGDGKYNEPININHIPKGCYVVKIVDETSTLIKRMVVN